MHTKSTLEAMPPGVTPPLGLALGHLVEGIEDLEVNAVSSQRVNLSEEVRRITLTGDPLDLQDLTQTEIAEELSSAHDVLSLLKGHGIEREIDHGLIVGPDDRRAAITSTARRTG